jgi:hypothetical protein
MNALPRNDISADAFLAKDSRSHRRSNVFFIHPAAQLLSSVSANSFDLIFATVIVLHVFLPRLPSSPGSCGSAHNFSLLPSKRINDFRMWKLQQKKSRCEVSPGADEWRERPRVKISGRIWVIRVSAPAVVTGIYL